jgi:hypothetical protein
MIEGKLGQGSAAGQTQELFPGTDVLVISVHGENALEVAKVSENLTLP